MQQLADMLKSRRESLNLSAREVARRAGLDTGVIIRLERAANPTPRLENLKAIGEVLGIPAADLYAAAHALPVGQLPSLRPYMRAKYRQLPDEAVAEVESFIEQLTRRHGSGPRPHQDEH
ncbi:Transcriptional regulator, contains XRE-family HTH domain [Jatrophihabitans endophyticus]|uniref:Transcriptional regulator, contains XRE-family HTH domain n=2 Tax=Jatrophihabitans endophyticus TaxID=1206085 RepID=A0A1M5RY00_9ACTN|nr:Transcriptional regulator, contains XRE-family HTH domain [Jatrophihabitans endophyticus]